MVILKGICWSNNFNKMSYFNSGQSYKAVLLDVDSKDPTLGMSCPPVQFLEQEVLDTIKACIRENGNLVLRNISIIAGCLTKSSYLQVYLFSIWCHVTKNYVIVF